MISFRPLLFFLPFSISFCFRWLRFAFVGFVLFRFHFVDFVSFRFVFVDFVSFCLVFVDFVSFRFVSFRFYFVSHFIGVLAAKKHSSIKLPDFFKTCSCSLVNSQTNFDGVSMYLKFGHKSITSSKNVTLIFSYKGQSTIKCFSSLISPLEQFVHFVI